MSVTGQSDTSYSWDDANRLTGITQGTSSVSFGYDNANRRTSLTLPNGIVLTYGYDNDSRVNSMIWALGSTQIGNLACNYDPDGRIIGKSGSMANTNLPTPVSGDAFNASNQMTAFGRQNLSYDNNGDLTSDGTNTYAWDARNHLSSISGGTSAAFTYDALGRRASKTINSTSTQFLYDSQNPVQELQGGSPSANLLTGLAIDEYFNRTDSSGSKSFLTDHLGSTQALTDSGGNVVASYTFDPFGNVTVTGASNANPYQFTGRENDSTGIYYYRARYYDPTIQRFVSQDPIGFVGGDINLYGYVAQSPTLHRDPSGEIFGVDDVIEILIVAGILEAEAPAIEESAVATGEAIEAEAEALASDAAATNTGEEAASRLQRLLDQANPKYPKLACKAAQNHHLWPKYLGGPENGPTSLLNPAYHQMITNAFQDVYPWQQVRDVGPPTAVQMRQIIQQVYGNYPIP